MRMLLPLLALILLMPATAFAAVFNQDDIGALIFRDFLKMTEYPGAPFTGQIINDLVMFLFIPSVFLILIIVILVLRMGLPSQKLAILMGVAFYAFVIFGGYYRIFALLAGPYFLFLIVIIGLFYFFLGHFGIGRRGMPGRAVGGGGMPGGAVGVDDADTFLVKLEEVHGLTSAVRNGLRPGSDSRYLGDKVARLAVLMSEVKRDLQRYGGAGRFSRNNPLQAYVEGRQHINPDNIIREAESTLREAERH